MIFDRPQLPIEFQDRSDRRRASLTELIAIFHATFSSVRYRVLEDIAAVNAQASASSGGALVDIFGGLAFHPVVHHDGLVFTLLHETGHHLSESCKLPWAPLACECAADTWATTAGLDALLVKGVGFQLEAALKQIEDATRPTGRKQPSRRARKRCVAMNWQERKRELLAGRAIDFKACQISSAIGR